jgi:DNA-binding PadR family transcriptional regulator
MSAMGTKAAAPQPLTRTTLEIFVLAAVRGGLDTPYDLNKEAGLSVGATIPLLARLQKADFLQSRPAARRSRQYSLTAKGKSVLEQSRWGLLHSIPSEFEAILRVAYVAAVVDGGLNTVRTFLRAAAVQRRRLAQQRAHEAQLIAVALDSGSFGRGHRWLRAFSDSVRLRAEAAVLSKIAARRDLAALLLPAR